MKHSAAIHPVPVKDIVVRDRHRRDMGDLQQLADSIEQNGLLQPIGITDKNVLVFGERRLRAVADILKRPNVDARVVRLDDICAGEYAENEVRKDFTASERVAIAAAVQEAMPERRGRNNQENIPEFKGQQSRDIAANRAGFGNSKTYQQAESVVHNAAVEVIAAMDSGKLAISSAALVAKTDPEEQVRIAALSKPELKEAVAKLRGKVNEALDRAGVPPPVKLPSPEAARKIAIAKGHCVGASNGMYIPPVTKEVQAANEHELVVACGIYDALQAIGKGEISPADMPAMGHKYACLNMAKYAEQAAIWITAFLEESKKYEAAE